MFGRGGTFWGWLTCTSSSTGRQRRGAVRAIWSGTFVLNTGRETGTDFCQLESFAEWGAINAAAVGRTFLANPDLVDRLILGAELNEPDVATFYSPGAVGCVDYPTLGDLEVKTA